MFVNLLDLYKAKTHKYTHKKRVFVSGKPTWKYYYKEHHGGGVTNVKDLKEGDAFKVNYKGQEGHFHVKKTEGNKVTVVLDETGKETTLSKSELRQVLLKTHATALKENVEKKKQTLAKRKSAKAKERAQQALDRAKSKIEGLEDEPKQEKQEQKETSIEKVLDIRLKRVIPQHSLKFNEQGLSTTAKDREIERFLAHIITDAVKDSIEDETSYTREEIDLVSSMLGNPSMVLVARKLYTASVGNKTPDQIFESLKLIYDKMKNDYTENIKQRKQKKQEPKQDQPSTDVESILREVNTEFEQKKDELEQKQAEREKKRQERKQAKEVKEAQQREKKRAQRERRAEFIRQRKEREEKRERERKERGEGKLTTTTAREEAQEALKDAFKSHRTENVSVAPIVQGVTRLFNLRGRTGTEVFKNNKINPNSVVNKLSEQYPNIKSVRENAESIKEELKNLYSSRINQIVDAYTKREGSLGRIAPLLNKQREIRSKLDVGNLKENLRPQIQEKASQYKGESKDLFLTQANDLIRTRQEKMNKLLDEKKGHIEGLIEAIKEELENVENTKGEAFDVLTSKESRLRNEFVVKETGRPHKKLLAKILNLAVTETQQEIRNEPVIKPDISNLDI